MSGSSSEAWSLVQRRLHGAVAAPVLPAFAAGVLMAGLPLTQLPAKIIA